MTDDEIIERAIQGHGNTRDAIRWALLAEREACAKVCENLEIPKTIYGAHPDYLTGKHMAVSQCAAAIRERMKND